MRNISLAVLVGLMASASAFAECGDRFKDRFDEIRFSHDKKNCVGLVLDEDKALDPIEGDLMWVPPKGEPIRIGGVPKDLVVVPGGVLGVYIGGRTFSIKSWTAKDQKFSVCRDGMKVQELDNSTVKYDVGKDFIRFENPRISIAYYEGCKNRGKELVYVNLSPKDVRVLRKYGASESLSNDLTDPVVADTFPEILGRDDIVDDIIATLRSSSKRSTLMWGPAGVGKTVIAYRLATRIVRGQVPDWLKDWKVYSIDISKLNEQGLKGKAQQKMTELVGAAAGKKVVLLMDELHQIIGMGAEKDGGSDITEAMKTTLANGQLAVIGTTTNDANELALLRTRSAFFSRFNKIPVHEPDDQVLMAIYRNVSDKLFKRFNVRIDNKVIKSTIELSRQYVTAEAQPRIGKTLLQNLAAKLNMAAKDNKVVVATILDIRNEVGLYTNIKNLQKTTGEGGKTMTFEEKVLAFKKDIRNRFVGHDVALDAIYRSLLTYAAGVKNPKKPAGIFLFLGPSGVGKTYLAEIFADHFGYQYRVFGMSQFKNEANIANFLGAPPTFVGYNPAGGMLTRWINNNSSSVLNFDEIDKAHPSIFQMLMHLMDKGEITDNSNVNAKFGNGFIFLTSNFKLDLIAAYDQHVLKIKDPKNPNSLVNYKGPGPIPQTESELKRVILQDLESSAMGTFLAGRIGEDRIIIFHHLRDHESKIIAGFEVKKALKRLRKKWNIVVDKSVVEHIASNGFSFKYGARLAQRVASNLIEAPVAEAILKHLRMGEPYKRIVVSMDPKNPGKSLVVIEK